MAKRPTSPPDPDRLQRERSGVYRSGNGRFVVTTDAGEWFVTDTERINEFGLEIVIGPLATLERAKDEVARQRDEPQGRPVDERAQMPKRAAEQLRRRPASEKKPSEKRPSEKRPSEKRPARPRESDAHAPQEPGRPRTRVRPARWERSGDERDAVADALRRIHDAWTSGEPERMARDIHPDVVFVQPRSTDRVEGRDAAIESYRDFMARAIVHEYGQSRLTIHVWDRTAVARYRWEMDWEMEGQRRDESGHDTYVFARVAGRWLAVWRVLE